MIFFILNKLKTTLIDLCIEMIDCDKTKRFTVHHLAVNISKHVDISKSKFR